MIKRYLFLFGIWCCLPLLTTAQNFAHRNFVYDWKTHHLVDIPVWKPFETYGAVVLLEEINVSWVNKTIRVYQRIKFLNQAAIDQWNDFHIPASFDPFYDYVGRSEEHRRTWYRPKIFEDDVLFLDARILKPDGTIEKALLYETAERETIYKNRKAYAKFAYHFKIRNIVPGDELEVAYAFEFEELHHYYFAKSLPVQESYTDVMLPTYEDIACEVHQFNGMLDSSRNLKNRYPYVTLHFDARNVFPIDYRLIQQPTTQLPHLTFYRTTFRNQPNAREMRWKDTLVTLAHIRDYFDMEYYTSRIDPITQAINQWYERCIQNAVDSTGLRKMDAAHQYINAHMAYQDDTRFLEGKDDGLPQLKKYLELGIMRQISKERLYREVFHRIGAPYWMGYFEDKRIFAPNAKTFQGFLKPTQIFALAEDTGGFRFYIPKSHHFGWFPNEVPFYLAGAKAYLIPQGVDERLYRKRPWDIPYPWVSLPARTHETHSYQWNANAQLDTTKGTLHMQAQVQLTGYFSTHRRGAFTHGYRDSSVSIQYSEVPFGATQPQTSFTLDTVQAISPYLFVAHGNYAIKSVEFSAQQSQFRWRIHHTFHPLIPPVLDTSRMGPVYMPDFTYTETFTCTLSVPKAAQLVTHSYVPVTFQNPFGTLHWELLPLADARWCGILKITVHKPQVLPHERMYVQRFYEQLQNILRQAPEFTY